VNAYVLASPLYHNSALASNKPPNYPFYFFPNHVYSLPANIVHAVDGLEIPKGAPPMSRITDTAKKIKPTRTAKKAGKNSRGRKVTPGRALVAIIAVALTGLGLQRLLTSCR
jgi:hypothetical protein